jgi:hypothetical protein
MDSDDREPIENQSIGDAMMIKMIPQEDIAVSNGTVLSISLGDGKVSQNLLTFMKSCANVYLQCSQEGFQFIGISYGKQNNTQRFKTQLQVFLQRKASFIYPALEGKHS